MADNLCIDHELIDGRNLGSCSLWHILILDLESRQELIANFPILRHLKLNVTLQSTVARRLHVQVDAELLLFFVQTVPLRVDLQVLVAAATHPLLLLTHGSKGGLLVTHHGQSFFLLLDSLEGYGASA